MKSYEFTVILPEIGDSTVDAIDHRCPDSSIGRSHGTMSAAFDREANSFEMAIDSAVADLHQLGVSPLRIEMDVPKTALVS